MYNGEVSVLEKYLPTVIKTAEYLEVKGLSITKLKDQEETGKVSVSEDKNFDNTINASFQNVSNKWIIKTLYLQLKIKKIFFFIRK